MSQVKKGDVVYHRYEKNRKGERWRGTVVSERIMRGWRNDPCIRVASDGSTEGFSVLMPLRQVVTQHTAPLPFVTPYCWGYWWVREDGFTCAWLGWHVPDARKPLSYGNATT